MQHSTARPHTNSHTLTHTVAHPQRTTLGESLRGHTQRVDSTQLDSHLFHLAGSPRGLLCENSELQVAQGWGKLKGASAGGGVSVCVCVWRKEAVGCACFVFSSTLWLLLPLGRCWCCSCCAAASAGSALVSLLNVTMPDALWGWHLGQPSRTRARGVCVCVCA